MPLKPVTLQSAREAYAAGRLNDAEAASLELLAGEPHHPAALHLLGLLRFQAGRQVEGAGLLAQAVQAEPDSAPLLSDLGAMLLTLGRPAEALPHLQAAVARDPRRAETQVNLGNALHAVGNLAGAEDQYRRALNVDPQHVRGLLSLGNLLLQLRRPEAGHEQLAQAAAHAPGTAAVHQFLGNALRDLGQVEAAKESYGRAIALEPHIADANESLGLLLNAEGRLEDALVCFRASPKPNARARGLECLLRLGRHDEFFAEIERNQAAEAVNLHSASLSAYAARQLGRPDPHPFCPDPLTHVRVVDRYLGDGASDGANASFLRQLIEEASQLDAVWEPRGVSTIRGFQTGGNLFHATQGALARLQADLLAEAERYRRHLDGTAATFGTRWPREPRLHGWFVRLLTGGHQGFHNHAGGWLSGCLYLQMPAAAPAGEGAIEFGLGGDSYPRLSEAALPTLRHDPKPGQLVLFPSSLYHRTIPFRSDDERLCIAFDVLPG
ncbi:MAG: putative 2OG-Fe(II) oxygenase [Gammaproteobacteria bacterium]